MPEFARILGAFLGLEADRLVGPEPSCPVMVAALQDLVLAVGFHPRDKPHAALVQIIEPRVVDVGSTHDHGCAGIEADIFSRRTQVVMLTVGDDRELGQIACDIDRGMQFDCTFCLSKHRPRRKRETQLDRRGVERKHLAMKTKPGFLRSHRRRTRQAVGVQILQDLHGPCPVRVRKRAPPDWVKAEFDRLAVLMGEYALDGADGVVAGHLAKEEGSKPSPAVQRPNAGIAVVLGDQSLKLRAGNQLDELGKNDRLGHGSENLLGRFCLVAFLLSQGVFRPFLRLRYAPSRTVVARNMSLINPRLIRQIDSFYSSRREAIKMGTAAFLVLIGVLPKFAAAALAKNRESASSNNNINAEDTTAISSLIMRERLAHETHDWDEMASCYRPKARISVSWFNGTATEFIEAGKKIIEKEAIFFDSMSPAVITIKNNKAIADTACTVHMFSKLEGIEVNVTSYTRLLWRAEKHDGRRLIEGLRGIYIRDTLAPRNPNQVAKVKEEELQKLRPSYRFLAYLRITGGMPARDDLPGVDKPEQVNALRAGEREWLKQI